ncbi:MAG: dihydropteroate synthase [Treponema sp.]|nr:dihydropteroate synthase [Treponema sp.]
MRCQKIPLPSGGVLDLSGPPLVMGIVNCNGDSFYPPSRAFGEAAVERALALAAEGAAIIDLGAESSRPGAEYIPAGEEARRLLPVLRGLRKRSGVPVSVDTRKAEVARLALDSGADIINDISGLQDDPLMAGLCAERGAAVVLMHMRGVPRTMQDAPFYTDAAAEVYSWLAGAARRAEDAGIRRDGIILDPGIGFGKRTADNAAVLFHLAEMCRGDYPVLVGLSRKSFIRELAGKPGRESGGGEGDILAGTLAALAFCVMKGASILRVHDVKETVSLVRVLDGLMKGQQADGMVSTA